MARTAGAFWRAVGTTYIQTTSTSGYDLLINGSNHYINFGTTNGTGGYGIRDNAGTIEFKNSGGSWVAIPSGAGTPGGADTNVQFNDGGSFGGNAAFNFAKTTGFVGIGAVGSTFLTVSSQTTIVTPVSGSTAQFVGLDANPLRLTFDTHNNTSSSGTALMGRRSRGTAGTPSAVQASDTLFSFNARGYGTSQYAAGSTGLITFIATETFTNTANGTGIRFDVTPNLSVTAVEIARLTSVGFGIGQTVPAAKLHINTNALGVTQADSSGILLENTTAAAAGAQQISPGIVFSGYGWKTTATAASQLVKLRLDLLPVQGTTAPTAQLRLASSINGGAYSTVITLDSNGTGNFTSGVGTNTIGVLNSSIPIDIRAGTSVGSTGISGVRINPSQLFTNTSGAASALEIFSSNTQFNPTSGTATFDALKIGFTINQTGGASGITRGIYLNPTLTAAASFFSIEITAGNIKLGALDMVLDTTTGTKIGTATTQKLSLWNATPIVQPTTGVAAATFVANTSLIANDTATFDGYTIGQVVKALRNIGALA